MPKECGSCQTPNADESANCIACGAELGVTEFQVDVIIRQQQVRKRRNRILGTAAAAAAIVAMGVVAVRGSRARAVKQETEDFYLAFQKVDEEHVGRFWRCVTREQGRSATAMQNNLELNKALTAAFKKAPRSYVKLMQQKCLPLVSEGGAPERLKAIPAPASLSGPHAAYVAAIDGLGAAAHAYVESLSSMAVQEERDQKLTAVANAFHYADEEGPDTWAYHQFLRCAVPEFDKLKEMQGVVEYLFGIRKEPGPEVGRWRRDCMGHLDDTRQVKADPSYAKIEEVFSADDREVQAFREMFEKADETQRAALLEPIEKAWFEFRDRRGALMDAIRGNLGGE